MPAGGFSDKKAIVTGASSGIGKAIALRLAGEGATVCLVGRNLTALQAVVSHVRAPTTRVRCYVADFTRDKDLLELTQSLQRDLEHIDVLVHSAGAIAFGPIEKADVEDFDTLYQVNVRAPFWLTQALLPWIKIPKGQIVFVNSSVSLRNADACLGPYSATKHALKAITDSLRCEVNADGVRVLSIYPGRTATPMQSTLHRFENKEYWPERLLQPEDVASAVLHALCLPRTAEITDISLRPLAKT